MENLFSVAGRVAVVTGAGGVLCGAISKGLAEAGAKVAVLDVDEAAAQAVAGQIHARGGEASAISCNVLQRESLEAALEKIHATLGKVDLLINGAGGNKKEATTSKDLSFFHLPSDAVRFVFELNFLGTFLPTQVFARDMADTGSGVILNISSMNAFRPLTRIPAYSAVKAAVTNFTQWLAVHMCQNYSKNIRVNAIAPGFFLGKQNRFLLIGRKSGKPTARGRAILDHTPMERFGEPADLVGAVLWLASDAAKFVTGIVVPIDGGFSACSGV